jgi:hypothetical protein
MPGDGGRLRVTLDSNVPGWRMKVKTEKSRDLSRGPIQLICFSLT